MLIGNKRLTSAFSDIDKHIKTCIIQVYIDVYQLGSGRTPLRGVRPLTSYL